jgi:hypothetical protein
MICDAKGNNLRDISPSSTVFPLSLSFHKCYTLTFLLMLLSVPPNRKMSFQISVTIRQKITVKLGPELFRAIIQHWFVAGNRISAQNIGQILRSQTVFMEVLRLDT